MSRRPRLVVFKAGDTAESVRDAVGDYDAMFLRILAPLPIDLQVVDAFRGAPLPPPDTIDLAIVTGSPESVTEPVAWVETLAAWARAARASGLPTLGICYGHQLLAYAHGGEVQVSAAGMEMGSYAVELTEGGRADPLLGALEAPLTFNQVHGDVVSRLPADAVHLARNGNTELQAFRLGDRTWGVQFHPEFTYEVMQLYVDVREGRLRDMADGAGLDPDAEMARARGSLAETPAGPALLRRFVELGTGLSRPGRKG